MDVILAVTTGAFGKLGGHGAAGSAKRPKPNGGNKDEGIGVVATVGEEPDAGC